ncbi:MAG: hypothetical protein U9R12_03210, partial [Candidatus Caldatribacteriota bacterium]|nr:hypothetical protein [Candidatus Caldatribacteriota bacterium]
EADVVVYEHIEKEGITSEVITARTAKGLFDYMEEKGLDLEADSIPVLNNYIGEEYSFVVSWITVREEGEESLETGDLQQEGFGNQNEKGVFISFPTEDLYFPLLPTSVYGDKVIPVSIRVGDYVTPKIFNEIEAYTTVEYYLVSNEQNLLRDNETFNWVGDSTRYTKIEIKAPSNLFVQDLWIEGEAPFKAEYTTFIINNNWVVGIYILLASSLASGLLIGFLLFKGLRKDFKKLVLLSLSNCFTLLGLIFVTVFINTKDTQETSEVSIILKELRNKGYIAKRRIATVLIIIFSLPILLSPLILLYTGLNILGIIFLLIFGVILLLRRVKGEDKELFKSLKQEGYSASTFLPKDDNKVLFLILYSPLFLIISSLLVRVIISSVK